MVCVKQQGKRIKLFKEYVGKCSKNYQVKIVTQLKKFPITLRKA